MSNPLRQLLASLLVIGSLTDPASAQAQEGPTPEQQAMAAQMQQMRQQVMQNMIAKGVDPRQFFQDMAQQMQDGTFDPADLQQKLLDQGLIDQASIDQMQGTVRKAVSSGIRQQLKVSDAEWAVLEPKIQKVLDAQASVAQSGPTGGRQMGLAGFLRPAVANDEAAKAMRQLKAAVRDPSATDQALVDKVAAWRAAHEAAKATLAAAQSDLLSVLTDRQEAILTMAGVL